MVVIDPVRTGLNSRRGRSRREGGPISYLLLTALAIFALGPVVLFALNALKTQTDYGRSSLSLPSTWEWENFATAWQQANMGQGLINSTIIVVGTVIGVCLVAGCAAYALGRLEIHGGGLFLTYMLVIGSLPGQLFLVPLFSMFRQVGLYDTYLGLIIIYTGMGSSFSTLLLRSFMLGIPKEFEEAARMDGASELQILVRVILPNAAPGFLTVALTSGLSAYNEFLFAVTFLPDARLQPVSLTFFNFQQGYSQNYALISAAGVIMIAPTLILFLLLQRRFIEGVASSGLGGI